MRFDGLPTEPPPRINLSEIFHDDDLCHFQHSRVIPETRVYNWYASYGRVFQPKRILEIGVRRGYGAYALIKGAQGSVERYLGIDAERDLPGSNTGAAAQIRKLGVSDVTLMRADTQKSFPPVDGAFDLVHIDGDHSMRGALNDFCHALPLLAEQGVIIFDDVESLSVRHAVALIQAALGDHAIFFECGGLHKQMLMSFSDRPPHPTLEALAMMAPPFLAASLSLEQEIARLRAIDAKAASLAEIGNIFSCVLGFAATRAGIAFSSSPATDAASVFTEFVTLAETLLQLAAARGINASQLQRETNLHGAYALERLADVPAPPAFSGVEKRADAFQPGGEAHRVMTHEAACNFAAICERASGTLSNALITLRQDPGQMADTSMQS